MIDRATRRVVAQKFLEYVELNGRSDMEWVIIIGIVVVVWIAIVQGNNAQRQKDAALRAYRNSLESLKKTPTDADLKQSTLALGRFYSNLTRDKKGNTVFDEVALM